MPQIPLTFDMVIVLGILLCTILLTLSNVIRVDVLGIIVLVVLGVTRLLPPEQLFSGFSSEAVMSLIAIMIIGAGLDKSGVAVRIARLVLKISREKTVSISTVLMFTSGFLSGFMRSSGAVSVLLPVVTRITARTGISKSQFLMPVAFCSVLGGTLTMVGTSPLILLNSLLHNAGVIKDDVAGFQFFSVLPIGLLLLVFGILYFIIFGKKLLPKEGKITFTSGTTKAHFLKTYGKGGDIVELRVPASSPLANITLKEFELKLDPSSSILAVLQGKELHFPPLRKIVIQPNALVAMMGVRDKVAEFAENNGLKMFPKLNSFAELLHPVRAGLSEAVIPPSSRLIGKELRELHMKRNYQLHVMALYRGNTVYQGEDLKNLVLRSGDTLGIFCQWDALADFHKNPDFVVLTTTYPREEIRPKKIKFAVSFFIFSLVLIVLGKFPVSVGLLVGAVGMIGTGVLSIDEAYESVSWKTVFLLAGLIPLGLVMKETHTTDWLTQYTSILREDLPLWMVEAILAILTTAFSVAISGVGATIVLVPIALDLAVNFGGNPKIFALIVAIAASNLFLWPSHQVNVLIAGPGGYTIKDFIKVGTGMTLLYWIIMLIGINLIF